MSDDRKLLPPLPGHMTQEGCALTPLTSQRMRTTIATVAAAPFPALRQITKVQDCEDNQLSESLLEAKGKHDI